MISELLRTIEGIAVYPIISLAVFVPFYAAVCIMVIRMRAADAERMSRLPLED